MRVSTSEIRLAVRNGCRRSAFAAADCPQAPREKWLHVRDMQNKIANEYGFAVERFQTEVYFNPVTGEIVGKKVRD